jgi:hypothetical protein
MRPAADQRPHQAGTPSATAAQAPPGRGVRRLHHIARRGSAILPAALHLSLRASQQCWRASSGRPTAGHQGAGAGRPHPSGVGHGSGADLAQGQLVQLLSNALCMLGLDLCMSYVYFVIWNHEAALLQMQGQAICTAWSETSLSLPLLGLPAHPWPESSLQVFLLHLLPSGAICDSGCAGLKSLSKCDGSSMPICTHRVHIV